MSFISHNSKLVFTGDAMLIRGEYSKHIESVDLLILTHVYAF